MFTRVKVSRLRASLTSPGLGHVRLFCVMRSPFNGIVIKLSLSLSSSLSMLDG